MERFSFSPDVAFVPGDDLLDGVTVAPLTAPFEEGSPMQAAIFRFAPGGRLVRHPAAIPEVFAVLEGSGEVSGADGVVEPIAAGEAAFWHKGEEQEMLSVAGLTVLITVRGTRGWPPARPSCPRSDYAPLIGGHS